MLDRPGLGTRPETGPMAFEGDWPGVFIRGDNAYGYITTLKGFLELHPETEGESVMESNCRHVIKELIGLLHSSNVSPRDLSIPYLKLPIQRMRDFVEAKRISPPRSEVPKVVETPPEVIHRLTFEVLSDNYAKSERKGKQVTDLWLCEEHYNQLKVVEGGHLTGEIEGEEARCKLWGATVHVSWKIPMNNFVIISGDDENLSDGVITHKDQLTSF